MIERRFFKGGNVRAAKGGKPGIEGYAAVFNEQYDSGWFIETIKPGAFSRAIKEKQDVRCLFNHDPDNLLGRTDAKTLQLMQDNSGLHFDCDLPDTQVGKDVRTMVDRGDLTGCSFAFSVTKQTWREESDPKEPKRMIRYRDIEDLDLYDVGPVTYPAYEGTSVGARSLFPDGLPAEVRSHVPELVALAEFRDSQDGDGPDNEPDDDPDDTMEECSCRCRACFDGECRECEMHMETCMDGDNCDHSGMSSRSEKRDTKTKRVAGEDLTASAFAYVGDPEKTETWKLPIKFSSVEKTKAHIRNALARFSQTQGIPDSEKPKVLAKIKSAARRYGIGVSDGEQKSDPVEQEVGISIDQAKAHVETLKASLSL